MGGHKGLTSIERYLNTKRFNRVRIGVSHPGSASRVHNWVLGTPNT